MDVISTDSTLVLILGGGRGTRLFPLTKERCKPAAPLGGKYRLIDVPISNCINSDMRKIFILTQFMSTSLNRHVSSAYNMDVFTDGFVNILAATQTEQGDKSWFQGTADAVRKAIPITNMKNYRRIVILSGDQLYKMDFRRIIDTHIKSQANITLSVLPVERDKVEGFGVVRINREGIISDFTEKPTQEDVIEKYRVSDHFAREHSIERTKKRWLANMGIYVFESSVLLDILKDESKVDFGKDVIPSSLASYKTVAHLFDGYWEDIGTIKSFFDANIILGSPNPPFDFFGSEQERIFTKQRFLAATRLMGVKVSESIISDGCFFDEGSSIINSVVGIRSIIGKNVEMNETVMMGADYYSQLPADANIPPVGIGNNVTIRRAILDKNVHIGDGAKIINRNGVDNEDGDCYHIRNGIVVIPKSAVVESGRII